MTEEQKNTQETIVEKVPDAKDVEKNKNMAIAAYFIFFLPLITESKESPFAKFHANQSFILVLCTVASIFVNVIPILGQIVSLVITIAVFIFWVMGIMNAVNGKMKELPIIGSVHILDK